MQDSCNSVEHSQALLKFSCVCLSVHTYACVYVCTVVSMCKYVLTCVCVIVDLYFVSTYVCMCVCVGMLIRSYGISNGAGGFPVARCYDPHWFNSEITWPTINIGLWDVGIKTQ